MEQPQQQSLSIIESELKKVKEDSNETYKKIKSSKTKNDSDILYKQFTSIYKSIQNIHKESYNLDDIMIWEDILTTTDKNEFDEYEKSNNDKFIFVSQLLKGTAKGFNDFNDQIK